MRLRKNVQVGPSMLPIGAVVAAPIAVPPAPTTPGLDITITLPVVGVKVGL